MPKKLQWTAVDKVVKPVTQVADVAVNNASRKFVNSPEREDIGKLNNVVPIIITAKKPSEMNCGVVIFKRFFLKIM